MKTSAFLFLVLITAVSATAREVILLGSADARDAAPRLAVVAGGTLTIDVVVPASLDRSKIVAGLWQASGSISLPLGEPVALDGQADAHGIVPVRIEFPKLERKARVFVKFTAKDEPRTTLGLAHVQVYPPFDWAPITRKLKKDGLRLLVFGADETLRAFFKTRDVGFEDNGDNPPDRLDRDTLAVGALTPKSWLERKDRFAPEGGGLIVFVVPDDGLPGVYTQAAGEGAITKVTLPVLARLAEDPRGEDLLFQLIEQHLHIAPAANP
jgi:hypothetical protein